MTDSEKEQRLKSLGKIEVPEVSGAAKERALGLAMEAFDQNQRETEKTSAATKGNSEPTRPTSIINWIKGQFSMNARFPIAATMTGLLLLPVGVFLFQNTSLTPLPPLGFSNDRQEARDAEADKVLDTRSDGLALSEEAAADPAPLNDLTKPASEVSQQPLETAAAERARTQMAPEAEMMVAPSVVDEMATTAKQAPLGGVIAPPSPMPVADDGAGYFAGDVAGGDQFAEFAENTVKSVASEPVSTFSIDVDTASYAYVRRALNEGRLPDPNAVRIEELVNYFTYDYSAPTDIESPFAPTIDIVATPWNSDTQLMRIGIEGYVPADVERPPVNLVFLVDTSGSMNAPDKLPLLKQALTLLVDQLSENDTVSIVAYAGSAGTVLEPTPATDKAAIVNALNNLGAGGSTAGAAGIELAYQLAEQAKIEGGINRVMLATDGDFNVGISSNRALKNFIEEKRKSGTFLSILGFGSGNLNDALMQTLAQNGNGSAYYIDSFREAHKVLVAEAGSTLVTIARDVKIQIEFNPALVAEYRLIGYETRALAREDFNNDRVDAGDVGAGHTVTALYELTPVGAQRQLIDPLRYGDSVELEGGAVDTSELGFFKLRYKLPDENSSRLIETPITTDMVQDNLAQASDDMRFATAVTAFGQKLRGSVYAGDMAWDDIRALAAGARGEDKLGYRSEFLTLVDLAASLSGQ
ncbi:MAG TPA: DUF3520 domain-containing protein [Devosia sp.]|nr:DUF3520 domain-containing protein [Devosia sp.]